MYALKSDVERADVVRQARLDGDVALVARHPDGHLALALFDGTARPEHLHVHADDLDLAEHALHLLLLGADRRRHIEDATRVADGNRKGLPGRERLRAQEVDGRDDVLRRPVKRGRDDARRRLNIVRVALGVLDLTGLLVEDRLARADALALLVLLESAQRVEVVRLDLRLGVELEAHPQELREKALRSHVGRQHQGRGRGLLTFTLNGGVARRWALSLEAQLGDVDGAQDGAWGH